MKKAAQIISYGMLIYLATSFGTQIIITFAVSILGTMYAMVTGGDIMSGAMIATNSWYLMIISIISSYIAAPFCAWLLIRKLPSADIKRSRLSVGNVLMSGCVCLGIFYLFGYISEGILWAVGRLFSMTAEQLNAVNQMSEQFNNFQYILLVCVCAPIVEEVFFRGIIINKMMVYGKTAAIVLSAAIFGLVHGTLSQIPYALALGLVLGYIYVRFGNIYLNIGLHAFMNFMGGVVYMLIEDIPYIDYIYTALMVCIIIAAIVILILKRNSIKQYMLENSEEEASAGEQTKTVLGNMGFILFAVACLLMMIISSAMTIFTAVLQ